MLKIKQEKSEFNLEKSLKRKYPSEEACKL